MVTTTSSRRSGRDARHDEESQVAPPAEPGMGAGAELPVPLDRVVRVGAAAASLAAAAVHASAVSDHSYHLLHVTAFVAMAAFQAWWAYLVLRSTMGRVLAIGAAGHGGILLLWLMSRTVGLPTWVPGIHGIEAAQAKDIMAAVLAVSVLAGIDILSRTELRDRGVRPSHAGAALGAAVLAATLLGVAGSLSTGHIHDPGAIADAGHADDQPRGH